MNSKRLIFRNLGVALNSCLCNLLHEHSPVQSFRHLDSAKTWPLAGEWL